MSKDNPVPSMLYNYFFDLIREPLLDEYIPERGDLYNGPIEVMYFKDNVLRLKTRKGIITISNGVETDKEQPENDGALGWNPTPHPLPGTDEFICIETKKNPKGVVTFQEGTTYYGYPINCLNGWGYYQDFLILQNEQGYNVRVGVDCFKENKKKKSIFEINLGW